MPIVRAAEARLTETPNGVMTTLASPSQGAAHHSLWRASLAAGAANPLHRSHAEQLLTVLAGAASLTVDGDTVTLATGDTAIVPAGSLRRVAATEALELLFCAAPAVDAVMPDGTDRGPLPWAA